MISLGKFSSTKFGMKTIYWVQCISSSGIEREFVVRSHLLRFLCAEFQEF